MGKRLYIILRCARTRTVVAPFSIMNLFLLVYQGPASALALPNSTMIGTGITPEGINQNYIMYDLMLENGYFAKATNLTTWITEFVKRR